MEVFHQRGLFDEGAIQQWGSTVFKFNLIKDSPKYQEMVKELEDRGLCENECDHLYDNLAEDGLAKLDSNLYIKVYQKTATWLALRARALGTASSVGKFIPIECIPYCGWKKASEEWAKKLWDEGSGFKTGAAQQAHMDSGVASEDIAMHHFSKHTGYKVSQIGTIRLSYLEIEEVGQQLCGEWESFGEQWDKSLIRAEDYLLISPDGIVYQPPKLGGERIGMLEIKCISPFHHQTTPDGMVTWAADMTRRMWFSFEQVPFYYVTQMALQALAGWSFYRMNSDDMMWLIRWYPDGFSLYNVRFYHLFKLGIWVARYYRWLKMRVVRGANPGEVQRVENEFLKARVEEAYLEVKANHQYEFVELKGWYPEFSLYRELTRLFKFRVDGKEAKS